MSDERERYRAVLIQSFDMASRELLTNIIGFSAILADPPPLMTEDQRRIDAEIVRCSAERLMHGLEAFTWEMLEWNGPS